MLFGLFPPEAADGWTDLRADEETSAEFQVAEGAAQPQQEQQ